MQYDSSTTDFPVLIMSVLSSFIPITANQGNVYLVVVNRFKNAWRFLSQNNYKSVRFYTIWLNLEE